MNMRRLLLYGMISAVLAFAGGCNGNGGGGTGMMAGGGTPGGGTPGGGTTTPPPTNPVSLSGLLMGYMTVPAGIYTVAAGGTMDVGHATFSCPAGGAACRITVGADGMVTSAGGRATAMPSASARADKMAADKKTAGVIMGIRTAQGLPVDWGVLASMPGTADPSNVIVQPEVWDTSWRTRQGIAIGRDRRVSHPQTLNSDNQARGDTLDIQGQPHQPEEHLKMAGTPEFMNQNMNTRLGQFTGEVHTRSVTAGNRTTTDKLQIYHDKQASGPVRWSEYYSMNSTVDSRTNRTTGTSFGSNNGRLGVTGVDYASGAKGVLTIKTHANNFLSAAETALFAAPNNNLPSAPDQTFTYGTGTGEKPRTFAGTFHGVAGRYACTGTTCMIARDSKGENLRFANGGTWKFTPTAEPNEILLRGLDHDTDYLVFGYWLQTVAEPGKDPTYAIGAIYRGSKPFGTDRRVRVPPSSSDPRVPDPPFQYFEDHNDAIAALRGTATYNGSAAGKYGLRVFDGNGSVTGSSAGSFTAKTTLTAQFGDDTNNVPINDQFSIKGTITEFTDPRNPGTDLSAWSVVLQRAKFGFVTGSSARAGEESNLFPLTNRARGLGGGDTTGMTGTTPGPGSIPSGPGRIVNLGWRGQFYGPTGTPADSTYPTGVTGTFKANFVNGEVFGAYGAKLQE